MKFFEKLPDELVLSILKIAAEDKQASASVPLVDKRFNRLFSEIARQIKQKDHEAYLDALMEESQRETDNYYKNDPWF